MYDLQDPLRIGGQPGEHRQGSPTRPGCATAEPAASTALRLAQKKSGTASWEMELEARLGSPHPLVD